MKKLILLVLGIVILWGAFWAISNNNKEILNPLPPVENIDNGNASEVADLIVVETPTPNSVLESSFVVKGQARGNWYFEASFPVQLVASDGTVLVNSFIMANGEWMTEEFVPFEKSFSFTNTTGATGGTLILKKDNPSDMRELDNELRIPVKFSPSEGAGTMTVKAYFNKPLVGTESCDAIQTAVTRTIPKTAGVAQAAIIELLKGPTSADGNLETSIPSDVTLNKIEIRNGTAYADFNDKLTAAGSCRVQAIRAQIEDTLKQFSTVQNVVISVDGKTEDILQP